MKNYKKNYEYYKVKKVDSIKQLLEFAVSDARIFDQMAVLCQKGIWAALYKRVVCRNQTESD